MKQFCHVRRNETEISFKKEKSAVFWISGSMFELQEKVERLELSLCKLYCSSSQFLSHRVTFLEEYCQHGAHPETYDNAAHVDRHTSI